MNGNDYGMPSGLPAEPPLAEENRKFWKMLVFGFLTCGIYTIIYTCSLVDEINTVCLPMEQGDEDRSPHYLLVCLLSAVTCGIYGLIWFYKQGDRMRRAAEKYEVGIDETGSTYLLWILLGTWLFGIGAFVVWYLLTRNTNRLARAYNDRFIRHSSGYWGEEPQDNTSYLAAEGKIRFLKGEYTGQVIPIMEGEALLMGRNTSRCQLIFNDVTVSRVHCEVRFSREEKLFYITDYSTYGTWMNNSMQLPPEKQMRCPPGSVIRLGNGDNEFMLQ